MYHTRSGVKSVELLRALHLFDFSLNAFFDIDIEGLKLFIARHQ